MVHRWSGRRTFQGIDRSVEVKEHERLFWLLFAPPWCMRVGIAGSDEFMMIAVLLGEAEGVNR